MPGFRRNQRGKIPEIIPVASTGFWGNMGFNDPPHLDGGGFWGNMGSNDPPHLDGGGFW